jgi:hypothetical protein
MRVFSILQALARAEIMGRMKEWVIRNAVRRLLDLRRENCRGIKAKMSTSDTTLETLVSAIAERVSAKVKAWCESSSAHITDCERSRRLPRPK